MTEVDWQPNQEGRLRIQLPQDLALEEVAALVDDLASDFESVEISRPHPRQMIIGGPGPESILITIIENAPLILGAAPLTAFAVRFFQRLADDAYEGFRRGVVGLAERLRARRGEGARITVMIMFEAPYPDHPKRSDGLAFELEITSLSELEQMIMAMPDVVPAPPRPNESWSRHWTWKAGEGRWEETVYDEEVVGLGSEPGY